MFGKLLSSAVKIVTCPIDIVESGFDVLCGGDGSKASKQKGDNFISEIRDGICNGLEDLDD
jgi:creatinine amidohydrolase/Fe(II)-dependent formamide hydrolase-like protein